MMGVHQPQEELFSYQIDLDRRVRADHRLRRLNAVLDLSFVRAEVAHCYGFNGHVHRSGRDGGAQATRGWGPGPLPSSPRGGRSVRGDHGGRNHHGSRRGESAMDGPGGAGGGQHGGTTRDPGGGPEVRHGRELRGGATGRLPDPHGGPEEESGESAPGRDLRRGGVCVRCRNGHLPLPGRPDHETAKSAPGASYARST